MHTILDAEYKAKAWVDSYNHHIDMLDFWQEQARSEFVEMERRTDRYEEYLSLARLHDDECIRLLGDLAHSRWELVTVDDDGHIALKDEQMALAI